MSSHITVASKNDEGIILEQLIEHSTGRNGQIVIQTQLPFSEQCLLHMSRSFDLHSICLLFSISALKHW